MSSFEYSQKNPRILQQQKNATRLVSIIPFFNACWKNGSFFSFVSPPLVGALRFLLNGIAHTQNLLDWHFLGYIIPSLCIFGLIGNILNIFILVKKILEGVSNLEKGSTVGLIALAASDFGFCFFTLVAAFVPNNQMLFEGKSLSYYMAIYGSYVINTFIKTSTAFTVILAVGRFYAVCFPLRARQFLKYRYTVIALVLSVLYWFCCHIPLTWTVEVQSAECPSKSSKMTVTVHYIVPGEFSQNTTLAMTMTYIWATIGFFIPFCILAYCNYKLVTSLIASCRLRHNPEYMTSDGSSSHTNDHQRSLGHTQSSLTVRNIMSTQGRISITFISIVLMFFILVCPSELLHFYSEVGKYCIHYQTDFKSPK